MDFLSLPITALTTMCGSVSAMLPASNLLPTSEGPLNDKELGGYVVTVICLIICMYMIIRMPFKTPPMMAACCCFLSSCSTSSSRIAKDVQRRVGETSEGETPNEEKSEEEKQQIAQTMFGKAKEL